MAKAVRISDRDDRGFLAVELRDILRTVGDRGPTLVWSIHTLEAVGDITAVWPAGMLDLEQRISDQEDGLKVSWLLGRLADAIDQTINCLARAARTVGADAVQTVVELEASDSADWTIITDDSTLDEVRRAFSQVVDVTPLR